MLIWTVSLAGNIATQRQTVALAEALKWQSKAPDDVSILSIFPKQPNGQLLKDNTSVTWTNIPSVSDLERIECQDEGGFVASLWPDLVISCRPEVSAIALGVKEASAGKTKVVHIQNPNGGTNAYNFDLSAFDLIVRQPHEKLTGDNVISSELALHGINASVLQQFREAGATLLNSLPAPKLAVLIGGSDEYVTITKPMFEEFGDDLRRLAANHSGTMIVVPSRRTDYKDAIYNRLQGCSNVIFDEKNYTAILAGADQFIVSAESLSMVAEPMATDKPIILYDFNRRLAWHPLNAVFQNMVAKGRITYFRSDMTTLVDPRKCEPYDELPELSRQIAQRIGWPTASRR